MQQLHSILIGSAAPLAGSEIDLARDRTSGMIMVKVSAGFAWVATGCVAARCRLELFLSTKGQGPRSERAF